MNTPSPSRSRPDLAETIKGYLSDRFFTSKAAFAVELTPDEWRTVFTALSETQTQNPAQTVPDGMWYFTFYCEDRDAVQRMRIVADAPRQFTCGVTGIAKKEKVNG